MVLRFFRDSQLLMILADNLAIWQTKCHMTQFHLCQREM